MCDNYISKVTLTYELMFADAVLYWLKPIYRRFLLALMNLVDVDRKHNPQYSQFPGGTDAWALHAHQQTLQHDRSQCRTKSSKQATAKIMYKKYH